MTIDAENLLRSDYLVLMVLRDADKPLTLAEIRPRCGKIRPAHVKAALAYFRREQLVTVAPDSDGKDDVDTAGHRLNLRGQIIADRARAAGIPRTRWQWVLGKARVMEQ